MATSDFSIRLASFDGQRMTEDMKAAYAEAGFVHKGEGNVFVECFHCGVQLKYIDTSTDPWYVYPENPWRSHAQKNSGCEYLILKKGKAFAQDVEIFFNGAQPLE